MMKHRELIPILCLFLWPALAPAQPPAEPEPGAEREAPAESQAELPAEAPREPGTEEAMRAEAAAAGDPVGAEMPLLTGASPADQARSIAWMLTVDDDRRLVSLFPQLREDGSSLAARGAEARRRLSELADELRRQGHRVTPPRGLEIARPAPDAPPPNFVPPGLLRELEEAAARENNPQAAEVLEELRTARRAAAREAREVEAREEREPPSG